MKLIGRLRRFNYRRRHYSQHGIVVVGWGPFRLPGEAQRIERAAARAQSMLEVARQAKERS